MFFITAAVLFLARLTVPYVTFTSAGIPVTLGQAHALCSSALGVISTAEQWPGNDCAHVALAYDGLNVIVIAAVVCLLLGSLRSFRRSRSA